MLITAFIILSLGICGDGSIRRPLWVFFLLKSLQLSFFLNKARATLFYFIWHILSLFVSLIVYIFGMSVVQSMAGSTQINSSLCEVWWTTGTVLSPALGNHNSETHILEANWKSIFYFLVLETCWWASFQVGNVLTIALCNGQQARNST